MKNTLFYILLGSFLYLTAVNSYAAVDPIEAHNVLINLIEKNQDDKEPLDLKIICAESNKSKPTLRQESGKYCEDPLFAYYALLLCLDYSDILIRKLKGSITLKYLEKEIAEREIQEYKNLNTGFYKSKCMDKIKKAKLAEGDIVSKLADAISKAPSRKYRLCASIPKEAAYENIRQVCTVK